MKRENDCYVGGFANYLSNDYSILGVIINTVYRFYARGDGWFISNSSRNGLFY